MGQSLSCIYIHLVFSTKNRKAFINKEIQKPLYQYMAGTARAYGSHVHEIGGVEDHVHILLTLPKIIAICKLTEIKKNLQNGLKRKEQNIGVFLGKMGMDRFLLVNPAMII